MFNGSITATSRNVHPVVFPWSTGYELPLRPVEPFKEPAGFTINEHGTASLLAQDAYGMLLSYDANGNIVTMKRNGAEYKPEMDNLTYYYYDKSGNVYNNNILPPVNATNRLSHITETVPAENYPKQDFFGTVSGS